jgi:hypothetical protein
MLTVMKMEADREILDMGYSTLYSIDKLALHRDADGHEDGVRQRDARHRVQHPTDIQY